MIAVAQMAKSTTPRRMTGVSGRRVVGESRSAQRLEVEEEEAELVAVAVAAAGKRYVSLSPNLPAHEALCFRADGNRGNRVAELPVETGRSTKGAWTFQNFNALG